MSPRQPADSLADTATTDPVPDLVENILGANQYTSVSYWLGWAAETVTGTNPWQWIGEKFAGDWAAVQQAGHALHNLGDFNAELAGAVGGGMTGLGQTWTGNASESARSYFEGYALAVQGQTEQLRTMGDELVQTSTGMYETANAVRALWQDLLDLLISIGLTASASAVAAATTGVGGLAGGLVTAALIVRGRSLWRTILTWHDGAWTAGQALIGVISGYLSALHHGGLSGLPAASYDHTGVS